MTDKKKKQIQQKFIERAKESGIKVHKNNVHLAKPLSRICGFMPTKHPTSLENLVSGR